MTRFLILCLSALFWLTPNFAAAQETAEPADPAEPDAMAVAEPTPTDADDAAPDTPVEEPLDDIDVEEEGAAEPNPLGTLAEEGDEQAYVVDRFEAQAAYDNYVRERQYDQAVDAAELALELTEESLGDSSMELVPVLNDLGTALVNAGRPAEAVPHFERSVVLIDDQRGIFSTELVTPLYGLGTALQRMGDHEGAIGSFQRAQHVTHRTGGVVNLEQVPLIQAIARSLMALDKWVEAENLQLLTYKIHRRQYGQESMDTLPAMYDLANWYHDIQDYRQARLIYRRGLKVLEDEGLHESPEALPALRGLARAYLSGAGENWHKGLEVQRDIVGIIDRHADDVDPIERSESHLELGDWYVLMGSDRDAWEQYRIGWELAQQSAANDRDWAAYFNRPHLIHPGANLSIDLIGYGSVGKEVYYDFEFTISRAGEPEDIEITGSNMHGQTRPSAVQAFRYARFRPRIVDGVTVETPGYRIRRVYPTDAPEDYGGTHLGTVRDG